MERIAYDEFGLFHENAAEHGLPYDRPPIVRREFIEVQPGRRLSALVWGDASPEVVLLHGGAQNAHTWDTVAMAMDRPLVAVDLPGHGHSDGPADDRPEGELSVFGNAEDVAVVVERLAPEARVVVGMSLGGLTTIALTAVKPGLVRKVVLVDVTPGVTIVKSKRIHDFVNGPQSFASFGEMLVRTMQFNPTRTESSLRRGILHNAVQREDGSWVWRHARWRRPAGNSPASERRPVGELPYADLWDVVSRIEVPLMLCRGMTDQSVVDDADEAELLKRLPTARIERFEQAGHSIQGDMPLELAAAIEHFAP